MSTPLKDDAPANDSSSLVGAKSPSINDTRFWRFIVLAAIKIARRCRRQSGSILILSDRFCVKCGRLRYLAEASSMQFIARNTSIPVPKVYCAFTRRGTTYIVMERIKGEMLGKGWVLGRSPESKAKLLSQLKGYVLEMRKLSPPPGTGISNVNGGAIVDGRLPGDQRHGPFKNIEEFHLHLREGTETSKHPDVAKLIELHTSKSWPPPVFTHGDLSSLNVLVRGDEIVGIVDWEFAGWLPSYWEYTTACQVNPQNMFWTEWIDEFLEPMPEELAMERLRQRWFGDF